MTSRCPQSNDGRHYYTKTRYRTKAEFVAGRKYGGRMRTDYICIACGGRTGRKPQNYKNTLNRNRY